VPRPVFEGGGRPERVVKGLPVSPGIVIGSVLILDGDELKVTRRTVQPDKVVEELARLDRAIQAAIADIQAVHAKAQQEMGKETAQIFLVHMMMLKDQSLIGPMKKLVQKEQVTADYAAYATLANLATQFRGMKDSAFATKVNDIDDLSLRLHRQLVGEQRSRLATAPKGSVVLAKDLTPSQAAGFDRKRIAAFATDLGGLTSHTAIIAKALEIPAVVGAQTMLRGGEAVDGTVAIIDGDTGTIILNPTPATLEQYRLAIQQRTLYRSGLEDVASLPCVTLDGVHIDILGNIELPEEVEKVLKFGGVGVGLYRSEYLWLTKNREPTEEEQFAAYKKCVELCKGRTCTIRTCDLGADKLTQSLEETPERNPFLGNRSIRYCLRNVPMFKRQLRAILRASAFGAIKLMFPLVTSTHELRQAKFILNDVMEELAEEKIAYDAKIQVGMMVEVPSAALQAEAFAREVDFFSIGTNDLIQYTLAVDRINERVAQLYQATHPAVIKLIRDVARTARRRKIPVSCCGESAADVEYAMLLMGMGLRTLSVSGSTIPQLKRFVRSVTIKQCQRVAREVLSLDSDVQVSALLRDRARKIVPEAFSGRAAE
jgi:phosphoenolpyruvate-protein phosphotransferase (PTS system enzyme I)